MPKTSSWAVGFPAIPMLPSFMLHRCKVPKFDPARAISGEGSAGVRHSAFGTCRWGKLRIVDCADMQTSNLSQHHTWLE